MIEYILGMALVGIWIICWFVGRNDYPDEWEEAYFDWLAGEGWTTSPLRKSDAPKN